MPNKNIFDVVLLFALPASGKSEVRRYMANISPEKLSEEFHIGDNLQLDDFPYVFMMRRIDEELLKLGEPRMYYPGEDSFLDGRDWATLTTLLNEDYYDMINRNVVQCDSAAEYLFQRLENAAIKVGINPRLTYLKPEIRKALAEALEDECRKMLDEKQAAYPDTMENKTIIVEMSRGGAVGSAMPLADPFGYQYTLRHFCPEILEKAAILYIEVTPEESRRKNRERFDPTNPGSSINHGTPELVMIHDYGCDDIAYLRSVSEVENTVTVKSFDRTYHLPIGVFNNMPDRTTFLRDYPEKWDKDLVNDIERLVKSATDTMWANYRK